MELIFFLGSGRQERQQRGLLTLKLSRYFLIEAVEFRLTNKSDRRRKFPEARLAYLFA